VFGKYTIQGFDVEKDGSYKCRYIDGYRLDKIQEGIIIIEDEEMKSKIISQISELKNVLTKNFKNIIGDWDLHNLVYSIEEDTIYNIDLEGFYTYEVLPVWARMDRISNRLDSAAHTQRSSKK
jgi:hypothetical protein